MRKHLFLHVVDALESHFEYFHLRYHGINRCGLSSLTRYIASRRMLAYGIIADCVDKYLKICERKTMECMKILPLGSFKCLEKSI